LSGHGSEEKNSQPLPVLEHRIIQPVAQCCTTELSRLRFLWKIVTKEILTKANLFISVSILQEVCTQCGPPGWGLGVGITTLPLKRKLLRSLLEIQPDFVEEAEA
jgi:hypothetical protein